MALYWGISSEAKTKTLYSCAYYWISYFCLHRWIVFRRTFFILGILYLMRSITMFVTTLPVASRSYALNVCAPKANTTSILLIAKRAIQLMSGFGLSMNGQHVYCGDYMYSGHTVVLVSAYLIIKECKFLVIFPYRGQEFDIELRGMDLWMKIITYN